MQLWKPTITYYWRSQTLPRCCAKGLRAKNTWVHLKGPQPRRTSSIMIVIDAREQNGNEIEYGWDKRMRYTPRQFVHIRIIIHHNNQKWVPMGFFKLTTRAQKLTFFWLIYAKLNQQIKTRATHDLSAYSFPANDDTRLCCWCVEAQWFFTRNVK